MNQQAGLSLFQIGDCPLLFFFFTKMYHWYLDSWMNVGYSPCACAFTRARPSQSQNLHQHLVSNIVRYPAQWSGYTETSGAGTLQQVHVTQKSWDLRAIFTLNAGVVVSDFDVASQRLLFSTFSVKPSGGNTSEDEGSQCWEGPLQPSTKNVCYMQ